MESKNALGIASMICGIVSLIVCCCNPIISVIVAAVAIILFIVERAVMKVKTGMATAGLVCGIVTIAIVILAVVIVALFYEFAPPEFISAIEEATSSMYSF